MRERRSAVSRPQAQTAAEEIWWPTAPLEAVAACSVRLAPTTMPPVQPGLTCTPLGLIIAVAGDNHRGTEKLFAVSHQLSAKEKEEISLWRSRQYPLFIPAAREEIR